jgi:nucleoside-diphosphate-sugar epimerase
VLGKNQDFSNRKARETLGWSPRIDYRTGLDATIDWLRSCPRSASAVKDGRGG